MFGWLTFPRRLGASILMALAVTGLGLALSRPLASLNSSWSRASYDAAFDLFQRPGRAPAGCGVVIVYLDLPSFRELGLNPLEPWPRALHARLLHRLTRAGARAVVFDVVFDEPGADAAADLALADAIRANGRTLLAADLGQTSASAGAGEWGRATRVSLPAALFRAGAAGWGVSGLSVEEDFTVRRHVEGLQDRGGAEPSLAVAAAQCLRLPEAVAPSGSPRWFRYYGEPFALPHVAMAQALDTNAVGDEVFRDQVVLVGARPATGGFNERRDEFRSPFRAWRGRDLFMPGVELHATQILNLLRRDWLRRLDPWLECLTLLAVACVGASFVWLRPLAATAVAGVTALAVVAAAGWVFQPGGRAVWFAWLVPVGAQVPAALAGAVLIQGADWYRARRQLEAARRQAEARVREQAALLDKAHEAILVQDLDGRLTYANPSAERLLAGGAATLDAALSSTPVGRQQLEDARRAVLERGEWHGEWRWADPGGKSIILESRWTLLRGERGEPKGLLQIISDVTEQRQLQAEALRMQRLEGIGALAGGMAHDLNNALAPVLMGSQLLRRSVTGEEALKTLALMEHSTRRSAEMVRQVLLFARGRAGEYQRLDLRPVVKEMEKLARDTFPRSIAIAAFLPDDLWPVRGNPTELHQVLLNLCVNARDAMPGGGALSLVADNVVLAADQARSVPGAAPGDYVSLLVTDSGAGIPPDVLPHIFEPFYSTKPEGKGTGLGLSTTSRIVRAHGGFISVNAVPEGGTAFEVLLPRHVESQAPAQAAAAVDAPRGQGQLVLVAEDELALLEMLRRGLEEHGYRVVTAANGEEAVSRFREHAPHISLVIADQDMPGMGGAAAIERMRAAQPGLRWVLMSGAAVSPAAVGAPDPAAGPLLQKPLDLADLLKAVARALA